MPTLTEEQERLRKNDDVQSVLFDKSVYDIGQVCSILRFMRYNCFYIDETDKKYRVRQFNPGLHNNPGYYIKKSHRFPGLEFVIEYPR